jgi:hypothetical protein
MEGSGPGPPRRADGGRAVARVLGLIIVAGRMIAHNWFDCDIQPQPAFINWAAGCTRSNRVRVC